MLHWLRILKNWFSGDDAGEPVMVEGRILRETGKAVYLEIEAGRGWLPKSKIELERQPGGRVKVSIPAWLFRRKFPG